MKIYNPIDVYYKFKPIKYDALSVHDQQVLFGKLIDEGTPFFAGRLGLTETRVLRSMEFHYKSDYKDICDQLCRWSGFFPNDISLLDDYRRIVLDALGSVDFLLRLRGVGENYLVKKYCKKDVIFSGPLGGWGVDEPWTKALKGHKVLVIHPFAETIESQYKKRELLFPSNPDILPEFELQTIKAVQTLAEQVDERFATWFEALDWMKSEIASRDFEIALIACGAYGFPLGAYIKSLGKTAVHVGGDLQMLFGILGQRWESYPITQRLYNDSWVRASEAERPKGADKVEGACYW